MSSAVGKCMVAGATLAVTGVVVCALAVLDSPGVAREKRLDLELTADMACMQNEIWAIYSSRKALPANTELATLDCLGKSGPVSGIAYTPTGATTYRLCATFRHPLPAERHEQWPHPSGYYCFNKIASGANDTRMPLLRPGPSPQATTP